MIKTHHFHGDTAEETTPLLMKKIREYQEKHPDELIGYLTQFQKGEYESGFPFTAFEEYGIDSTNIRVLSYRRSAISTYGLKDDFREVIKEVANAGLFVFENRLPNEEFSIETLTARKDADLIYSTVGEAGLKAYNMLPKEPCGSIDRNRLFG